ncbi:MAG: carboxypeptidase-like regulatory domain-containing protein [Longimicrobiales bacterium]
MRAALMLVSSLLLTVGIASGQEMRGRVVDDGSRRPVVGATATLLAGGNTLARAATDANGFFSLRPSAAGDYEIAIEMIGYAAERRTVTYNGQAMALPAFVLKTAAIPLDPVEASARRESNATAEVGFLRASHVIAGARLAQLEQQAARPITLVREIGGLRVREFVSSTGEPVICVESRRAIMSMNAPARRQPACQWPVIVIDGIKIGDSSGAQQTFRELQLQEMESFEYLTPVEAGQRYGLEASAQGALVIWTRGRGPHKDPARNKQ